MVHDLGNLGAHNYRQHRQTPPESRLQASLPPWETPAQIMFESTCGNAVDHENDDDDDDYFEQPLLK